jgi:hypothetical protein
LGSTNTPGLRTGARPALAALACILGFTLLARRFGYKLGGNVIVRCRQGHLFTTLWIPGVKLTAVDLGVARWQRCPVGRHWSLVTPVRDADLTEQQRRLAAQHRVRAL